MYFVDGHPRVDGKDVIGIFKQNTPFPELACTVPDTEAGRAFARNVVNCLNEHKPVLEFVQLVNDWFDLKPGMTFGEMERRAVEVLRLMKGGG